ncbi:MAG TPA: intein-containing Rv2578c family radical SAM protein [Actinoplanes sp.]|nr:intein-containing Rv2578c family radical SAM protein [Actinoplanes sp.]
MRWANLSDGSAPGEPPPPALPIPGTTMRTFATPDFKGITCYEIQAKSIINRVPGASGVPFEWTINPYRGCSHACSYCLGGDTAVLLGDGSTRRMADLRVGDIVYGTVGAGTDRRYVRTTVLNHWSTRKPAHRVTLADGTRLLASGDHRFLTRRGWRHVTAGDGDRPHLAIGDTLYGVGRLADGPKETADYRCGYLCGLIRGDAARRRPHLGADSKAAHERTAAERAAWHRADEFLRDTALHEALRWPDAPTDGWWRGFLAGAYHATGSLDGVALRFTSPDRSLLHRITEALRQIGVPSRAAPGHERGAVPSVQIDGDLWAALRLRHATGAALPLDATGLPVHSGERLAVVDVEPLGLTLPLYDITTGTGDFIADGIVSHNCFARNTHTYLDLDPGHDFDTKIIVKVNAGELVRRELAAPSWRGERIAMGTNVDCYQRAEGRYRLMPSILAALRDFANPFSILTKGTLILRDLDLLRQAATVTDVGLSFSVGFVDEAMWRAVEPGTPSPRRRLDAVRTLTDAGFAVGVLMAPILPGLTDTDESIEQTVAAVAASGAVSLTPIALHLRPGAREWYAAWLTREHPRLAPRYRELYGTGSYLPQAYQREIAARVRLAARRYGLHGAPAETRPARASPAAAQAGQQLTLL